MERVIKVSAKLVYGKERFYPENEEANLFAELLGQKSFFKAHLKVIAKLGFKVEVVSNTLFEAG